MAVDYNNLPKFIASDANEILAAWKDAYKAIVGRPLLPAQTEALLIQVGAAREKLMRDDFNEGGRQMLLDFSKAPLLDYLAALVAVKRLGEKYATTSIEVTIIDGHTGVTIPELMQVQSTDGKAIFQTDAATFVPAGTYTVIVHGLALTPGVAANGYAIGGINSLLEPPPFVVSAQNSTITAGGSDSESDEQLAQRTKLAPSGFSNAGPYKAYEFFALSAHPSIVACGVYGPDDYEGVLPGQVALYPLVPGLSETPSEILDAVYNYISPGRLRPLNDEVLVLSPESVPYNIVANLTLYKTADNNATVDDVGQRLNNFCQKRKTQLAQDVNQDQLKAIAAKDTASVYKAQILINGDEIDLAINPIQYALIGTITVNIVDTVNG